MTSPTPSARPSRQDPPAPAVVVVERRLYEDGAARSTLRLVQRWALAGVRVRLYVLQRLEQGAAAPLPAGVVPTHPAGRELRLRWALVWGLVRLLPLARRADVVVAGREIGWGLLVGRAASWVVRRPFVVMIRSEPGAAIDHHVTARLRALMRRSITSADRVVCISPGLVPAVEALGVEPSRVAVVLNGVDVQQILSAAGAPSAALPPGEGPVVVAVGRLARQKGFDLLVEAHARVVAAGLPHRLVLLGEGPDRAALQRMAADLGVAGSVHLPGFTANPLPAVAAADLFCLPSRWEGFGQSLAEAVVLGTPVIAADCVSGPRTLLHDGAFGDLVPVDDVDALAAALEQHLRDPRRLRTAAEAGRAWAHEALDVGRTAREVLDVLRAVVDGRGRRD